MQKARIKNNNVKTELRNFFLKLNLVKTSITKISFFYFSPENIYLSIFDTVIHHSP